ncbi:MAG TPA: cytochrome c [Stellaceae bacterium]|nr:cytochrome c [Stellaceae bacterium]
MKIAFAVALAMMALARAACADGLSQDDYQYLQKLLGLTPQSATLAELTSNEQQSLHSAINDLKLYPESRDRQVARYLALVYGRECKRWALGHSGQNCSPASDPAVQPGKEISDKICATCHLFGSDGKSFYAMANEKDWDPHKVEHALRHTQGMVPIKLTPDMLGQLAAYINSFKSSH